MKLAIFTQMDNHLIQESFRSARAECVVQSLEVNVRSRHSALLFKGGMKVVGLEGTVVGVFQKEDSSTDKYSIAAWALSMNLIGETEPATSSSSVREPYPRARLRDRHWSVATRRGPD